MVPIKDYSFSMRGSTDPKKSIMYKTDGININPFIIRKAIVGPDYTEPFYVEDISGSDNTLIIAKKHYNALDIRIQKSTDKVNWTTMGEPTTSGITATVPANSKLYLRCSTDTWGYYNSRAGLKNCYVFINSSSNYAVGGNIMSLLYGSNFTGQETVLPSTGTTYAGNFNNLFIESSTLKDVSKLLLPATTLQKLCYYGMFYNCTGLTTAPALPATTLAESCYQEMFHGCSNLTKGPELPATTLANSCYLYMFNGCSSLTTAPSLSSTTLTQSCYYGMFYKCTGLTTAPELPATTLANSCYNYMFSSCSSLTVAPELPATTLANYCYSNMFKGCTSLTTAPALSNTTLAQSCYYGMFNGCTALTTAPELPATTLANSCYYNMFYGCTSLNYIKVGFTVWPDLADSGASDYRATYAWTQLTVNTTGTFVCPAALPQEFNASGNNTTASTPTISGYTNAIPYGWTVQTY